MREKKSEKLAQKCPLSSDVTSNAIATNLNASWERCVQQHKLDPGCDKAPDILSESEIRIARAPLDKTIATAQDELERLHAMVHPIGYATILADPKGIILERYCRNEDADAFNVFGTRSGGLWAEHTQGTNGIGTCAVEKRPLNVHRQQHFRHRYSVLSCSGAPIFDADGTLKAVLNVASHATAISDRSHALALAITVDWARAIEERDFRESHRQHWILVLQPNDNSKRTAFLAADKDQRITASDRNARSFLGLDIDMLRRGIHLREVFERYPYLPQDCGNEDRAVTFITHGCRQEWHGIATPPERASSARRNPTQMALHTRPRSSLLERMRQSTVKTSLQGGLPQKVLRSTRQYIESNLAKNVSVEELARMTGLSASHFSRQFKNSTGVSPHHYLTQQRVDMAARLLIETDRTLADIAQAVGFSDQSHFTRGFIRQTGSTPSTYRHANR